MCTTASRLCRLVFYFHIGAIFSGLSLRWCLRASSSYYFHHKNLCVCARSKEKLFLCVFSRASRGAFFHHLQVDQKRDLSFSRCRRRVTIDQNVCEGKFLAKKKLPLSVVVAAAAAGIIYVEFCV